MTTSLSSLILFFIKLQNFRLVSKHNNFAFGLSFSSSAYVTVPTPGPYSTTQFASSRATWLSIWLIKCLELGAIAATSFGLFKKFEKKTSFEFIKHQQLLLILHLLFDLF